MTVSDTQAMEAKSFDTPDEVRSFTDDKGHVDVVTVGGQLLGMGHFEPGWRWSVNVKPIAGTDSCQANHTGVIISGRMVVRMDSGQEMEFGPGDAYLMPPGHDAWVVGDEPCVAFDFTGMKRYATPS